MTENFDGFKKPSEYLLKVQEEEKRRRKLIGELLSEEDSSIIKGKILAMDFDELTMMNYELKNFAQFFKKSIIEKLDVEFFSKNRRTFKEVLEQTQWSEIEVPLKNIFDMSKDEIKDYHNFCLRLLNKTPLENEDKTHILMREWDDEIEETDEIYFAPVSINEGTMDTYALDFVPWEDILSYYCDEGFIEKNGAGVFCAYVLEDITFDGMTEDAVDMRKSELLNRIDQMDEEIAASQKLSGDN